MENLMMLLYISFFYWRIIEMYKGLWYMFFWEIIFYCEECLLMFLLWFGRKGRGGLLSVLILYFFRLIIDDKMDGKF